MSKLAVTIDDQTFEVELELSRQNGNGFEVRVNGQPVRVRLPDRETTAEQMEWIVVDDKPYEIVMDRDMGWIRSHSRNHRIEVSDLETPIARPQSRDALRLREAHDRHFEREGDFLSGVQLGRGGRLPAGHANITVAQTLPSEPTTTPIPAVVTTLSTTFWYVPGWAVSATNTKSGVEKSFGCTATFSVTFSGVAPKACR